MAGRTSDRSSALWLDDAFHFITGETTRKGKNLAGSAGPPPYAVYELTRTTIFGLPGIAGTEEGVGSTGAFSPTRWRF